MIKGKLFKALFLLVAKNLPKKAPQSGMIAGHAVKG